MGHAWFCASIGILIVLQQSLDVPLDRAFGGKLAEITRLEDGKEVSSQLVREHAHTKKK